MHDGVDALEHRQKGLDTGRVGLHPVRDWRIGWNGVVVEQPQVIVVPQALGQVAANAASGAGDQDSTPG